MRLGQVRRHDGVGGYGFHYGYRAGMRGLSGLGVELTNPSEAQPGDSYQGMVYTGTGWTSPEDWQKYYGGQSAQDLAAANDAYLALHPEFQPITQPAPIPQGAPAPGGSAPGYDPLHPAPWPPQDTGILTNAGYKCLPPSWPAPNSGYYTSGNVPVPPMCQDLTLAQLTALTGQSPTTFGLQANPDGTLTPNSPLPPVIYGGPGGNLAFRPGGYNPSMPAVINAPAPLLPVGNPLKAPGASQTVTPQSMTAGGTGVSNAGTLSKDGTGGAGGAGGTGGAGGSSSQQQTGAPDQVSQWIKDNWVILAAGAGALVLLPMLMKK